MPNNTKTREPARTVRLATSQEVKLWATTPIATKTTKVPGGASDPALQLLPGFNLRGDRYLQEWQRTKNVDGKVEEVLEGHPEKVFVLERFETDSYRLVGIMLFN